MEVVKLLTYDGAVFCHGGLVDITKRFLRKYQTPMISFKYIINFIFYEVPAYP